LSEGFECDQNELAAGGNTVFSQIPWNRNAQTALDYADINMFSISYIDRAEVRYKLKTNN
jgi:hypothetical protein